MKAPAFAYRRPEQLEDALSLLADDGTQVLAGGQSLIASLNMRLSTPTLLVDINRIAVLRGIEERPDGIRIGALVRHADVLTSELIARRVPLLAMALPHVAHMAVRNRGTTCGSLALADPSAEMPALAVTLNANIVLASRTAQRIVAARDFFQGLYQTGREDDEMITEVIFPCASDDEIFGFAELARRHGDFATVGAVIRARRSNRALEAFDVTIFGSEPTPLLSQTAASLRITVETTNNMLADIAEAIAADMEPMENHQGRADTKRRQTAVLLRRTLKDMQARAFHVEARLS
ncbi:MULTISPECIES: FAD binding domain-containing protein [unclassified Beijerinckia]|uniref:FAD binding domain-containing protein n=1 Tax=unclassified Beijerinckia TaxID=2638183 RepID=UPI00089AEC21|nr:MULTISPECIES: FAD binding domain-containing protein [unclassified Beijerinckia]MDH7798809.1 carbon-monoxide dehydrogenase medium subunit [Beijerinckia sp. GAS462]SED34004.1 carbon-monoxide dehydrogenase medium subunit [Beijerinckia sp. 28-YEA-48]